MSPSLRRTATGAGCTGRIAPAMCAAKVSWRPAVRGCAPRGAARPHGCAPANPPSTKRPHVGAAGATARRGSRRMRQVRCGALQRATSGSRGTAAFPGNDTPGHAGPKAYQPNIHPARPVVTPAPHVSPLSPNGGVKLAPSVISPSPSIARPVAPQAPVVHPLAPAPHVSAPAPAAPAPALAVKPGG